ncbi:MAG: NAD(P)-dependent oxidoreductase [Mycobacteriales bacterium]
MTRNQKRPVAVIGAGTMGGPAAAAARAAGHSVTVFDLDPIAIAAAVAAGHEIADTPATAAAGAAVVLLSLPTPDAVRTVLTSAHGVLAGAASGTIVVDLSTIDPVTARDCARAAAGRGVDMLDAPVLGRPHRCGRWTLPVGGERDTLERARPVLGQIAASLVHVGGHGAGMTIKLLNNYLFGVINTATAECMAAADRLGIDPAQVYDVLAESGAATISPLFLEIAPKMLSNDFSPAFTVDLLAKDIGLAVQMIDAAGARHATGTAAAELTTRAQDLGLGDRDTSAVVVAARHASGER